VNLVWETVSLTHYLLYLVAISHTKSCLDVLKPEFWTKMSRFGMELGIMCPTVGIPCQRHEFERLAPKLPNNLCEKLGDSDALQIMDTKPQPSSVLGWLPINGNTRLQRANTSVEKLAVVTPFILLTQGCKSDCRWSNCGGRAKSDLLPVVNMLLCLLMLLVWSADYPLERSGSVPDDASIVTTNQYLWTMHL